MRALQLLLEAARNVRYQPVAAAITLLVVALTCAATLLTVGRTAAGERDVAARLEAAGSREITISDTATPAHASPTALPGAVQPITLSVMASATGVQKAVIYASPVDAHNPRVGDSGATVPTWMISGRFTDVFEQRTGRPPRPGEAVISRSAARTLGLVQGIGSVEATDGAIYPVVGTYQSIVPFIEFDAGALVVSDGTRPPATLRLLTTSAAAVPSVQRLALQLVQPADPSTLRVSSPAQLAELQKSIGGDLSANGRGLLLLIDRKSTR